MIIDFEKIRRKLLLLSFLFFFLLGPNPLDLSRPRDTLRDSEGQGGQAYFKSVHWVSKRGHDLVTEQQQGHFECDLIVDRMVKSCKVMVHSIGRAGLLIYRRKDVLEREIS